MLKTASLKPEVKEIILNKGTEHPNFTCGIEQEIGSYLCRQCGINLFKASNKFESKTGWPSFDISSQANVKELLDNDQIRTEIVCNNCEAHLGHVFYGEGFTKHNARYCVNSLSLDFISQENVNETEEIIVAAGCFWGVEYYFKKLGGVLKTEVGYIGGHINHPTYEQICNGDTGHYEAIRIIFHPKIIDLINILKYFFEIYDFTQMTGQGNDIGEQYKSRIFCYNNTQNKVASSLIDELIVKQYRVATKILEMTIFWPAEEYHQEYYNKNGQLPYCHVWQKIF